MLRRSVRTLAAAIWLALFGALMAATVTGAFAQTTVMHPTGVKPTSRPSDSGMMQTRRDGESIEDRVARLETEAEAALKNCDEAAFWAARRALMAEVAHVLRSLKQYADALGYRTEYEANLSFDWSRYLVDVAFWQYIRPPDCPRTTPGQALLVPVPEQPALQPRSYGTQGDWNFVMGEVCSANPALAVCTKSNTPSVNLASDSGTSCTYTAGVPTRLPLIPINNGGPSIAPQTSAGGTPSSPPPGAAPGGTQIAAASPPPGNAPAEAPPPAGGPLLGPAQAEALADILFPSRSGPSGPAKPTALPPGFFPPPPGPATSDDPSTWTAGPPGGIPPDAVQGDGTYVSPETIEWLKNELDQLIEKNRQRHSGQDNSATPGSTPPAPTSSAPASTPAWIGPVPPAPFTPKITYESDLLPGSASPPPTAPTPPSSAPAGSDAPPAATDKPATIAEPAGTPAWIGPVPSAPFSPKVTFKSEPLFDSAPPASSTGTPPPSTSPPPTSTSTPAPTPPGSTPGTPAPVTSAAVPDAPQEIRITIHIKLNVANLPQAEVPKTTEGHIAGLLVDVPALPGKPGTSASQTAQNSGAGQDTLRCRAGTDGSCMVSQKLGGPTTPGTVAGSYRVDVPVSQTAGGVIETTGSKAEPNLTAPAGLNVIGQTFAVGPRTFMRVGFAQPFGLSVDPNAFFHARFGDTYKIDFCFDEAPMGAHAIASSVLNSELPAAAIKLRLSSRPRSSKR